MPKKIITTYRPDMLRTIIDRLDRLSSRLHAVATWMEEEGRAELPVTNHSSMVQGLEYAEAFGHAAERAADDCRLGDPISRTVSDADA